MKPVPSVLLIVAVLLSNHVPPTVCRPRDLRLLDHRDDFSNLLEEVLLRAGTKGDAVSLLSGRSNRGDVQRNLAGSPTFFILNGLEEPVSLAKRNQDPPISIDLTFHLLRNMIEMARNENQREQAELNRKYLDEIGK